MMTLASVDWLTMIASPWTNNWDIYGWIMVMGFLSTLACSIVGNILIWRKMALISDAISHSIVPGIVIAFLITNSRAILPMLVGAIAAGTLTTFLVEFIHTKSRIKMDAALGIVFSTFFAIGIIFITLFADHVDLDTDCVLFGDIAYVPLSERVMLGSISVPQPVLRMAIVCLGVLTLLILFYKELLLIAFDTVFASTLGLPTHRLHYGLMVVLAFVIVSAFEALGAILVVALLIFPGSTAMLLTERMPRLLGISALLSLLYPILGTYLAIYCDCSIAAAMVVVASGLFFMAWLASPKHSLIRYLYLQSASSTLFPRR